MFFLLKIVFSLINIHTFIFVSLNEKVGLKIPTTRYCKKSILCGARYTLVSRSGLPVWGGDSGPLG